MKKPRRPKPVLDLPSPEEANLAAAELSDMPRPVAKKESPPPEKKKNVAIPRKETVRRAPVREKTVESIDKTNVGRPRANHGRKSTSVMVKPEIWKRLKFLALQRDVDLSEMLENLFETFLAKEEKK